MDSEGTYFWCLVHHRVETGDAACSWSDRLGPYSTEREAARALQTVQERNRKFDAEDAEWEDGTSS
ncbi:MAG: hypothetical protein ABJA34_07450 [Pseudonocardiales bacterium]